jgi:hypothetical protein
MGGSRSRHMSGLGFKTFNTGDVLTAADVNGYLMQQTVMVFDDDADRSTELGVNVSEGMVSYRKDDDLVEKYNGTAWVGIAPAAKFVNFARAQSTTQTIGTSPFTAVSLSYTPANASNLLVIELTGAAFADTDTITASTARRVEFVIRDATAATTLAQAILSFGFPTANSTAGTLLTTAPLVRAIVVAGSTTPRTYEFNVTSVAHQSFGVLGDPASIISVTELLP